MKITILGPAHPYRGGLAAIMQSIAREFKSHGDEVEIKTFSLQYPEFLFPGKSQTLTTEPPEDLDIERCVNTMNPLNWIKIGLRLKRSRPDIIVMKYWTPFMAPCLGTIARIARSNRHTKVICHLDNVEPHEHHLIDRPCNKYFLGSVDGYIYMSEQVRNELKRYSTAPAIFSPHPMFDNFGTRVTREAAAEALGLDIDTKYAMFFGLIREYKGLDMLFDAWAKLRTEGATKGRKLIIAGEFYTSPEPYLKQIEELGIREDIVLLDRFIPDDEVKNLFSLVDFVVLPYHTASQSGVTQIAYNFCTPLVVTRVGGLPEIVPDGVVGCIAEPNAESIAQQIKRCWQEELLEQFKAGMQRERTKFTWSALCLKIKELYALITN